MFAKRKVSNSLLALAVSLVASPAVAAEGLVDSASLEVGSNARVRMLRAAVQSDWDKRWFARDGRHLTGYWDASLSYLRGSAYRGVNGRTQHIAILGFTPVLRYQNDSGLGFYAEAGIGVNLFSRLYNNDNRQLSTGFQFGDHLAVGYVTASKWDLGFKFQHYSNASIKKPNDGVNIFIVKASYRF